MASDHFDGENIAKRLHSLAYLTAWYTRDDKRTLGLVIGANPNDHAAHRFSRAGLWELIEELQRIHGMMEGPDKYGED